MNGVLESYATRFWHGETYGRVQLEGETKSGFEYREVLDGVNMVEAVFMEYGNKLDSFVTLLANVEIPRNTSKSKKTLGKLGMDYKKINAYPNEFILYKAEYEELRSYLVCGVSR